MFEDLAIFPVCFFLCYTKSLDASGFESKTGQPGLVVTLCSGLVVTCNAIAIGALLTETNTATTSFIYVVFCDQKAL